MKKLLALIAVVLTIFLLPQAHAEVNFLAALAYAGNLTAKAPTTAQIEVGFSPDEGAENLVLKTIGAVRTEIRVLSYSFTSAPITQALLAAGRRGVDVAMIVDHKNSENVIVLWNHPDLAQICLRHWQDRYARGRDYLPG